MQIKNIIIHHLNNTDFTFTLSTGELINCKFEDSAFLILESNFKPDFSVPGIFLYVLLPLKLNVFNPFLLIRSSIDNLDLDSFDFDKASLNSICFCSISYDALDLATLLLIFYNFWCILFYIYWLFYLSFTICNRSKPLLFSNADILLLNNYTSTL